MKTTKTVTVRLMHNASIPNARWCVPVGWEPQNEIEGAEFVDGSWWSDDEEEAGLVWFGDRNAYGVEEVIEASPDDLRVASCGNCRVIGEVELPDEDEGLVCGSQVQVDKSGVGHCWVNVSAADIPANIREEIEGEMIDGGKEDCDDFIASNGLHYRW